LKTCGDHLFVFGTIFAVAKGLGGIGSRTQPFGDSFLAGRYGFGPFSTGFFSSRDGHRGVFK
jgi:hypothetical protein